MEGREEVEGGGVGRREGEKVLLTFSSSDFLRTCIFELRSAILFSYMESIRSLSDNSTFMVVSRFSNDSIS